MSDPKPLSLVVPAGRRIAEVSWPAYSRRRGGTCDFMTTQCKEHCILQTNHIEKDSFAFFEDNSPPAIVRKLIDDINALKATVLCWFIGSGDCPKRMTSKLIDVIRDLSEMGIRQHGFTRNMDFWYRANQQPKCTIVLTVEKGDRERYDRASELIHDDDGRKTYLIAEPDYRRSTVRIYRLNVKLKYTSVGCGGGWVIDARSESLPPQVTVEDCSLCLQNNDGCFSIIKGDTDV